MNKLKDIVPIQQERDLKELGFNFENEHCYLKQKLSLFEVEEPYGTFDLILFSQAFRWFREKYNLTHMISENLELFIFGIEGLKAYGSRNTSYEEAELACLIKLIEIVKTKKYE